MPCNFLAHQANLSRSSNAWCRRADAAELQSRQREQSAQEAQEMVHHLQAQLEALTAELQQARQERNSLEAHFQARNPAGVLSGQPEIALEVAAIQALLALNNLIRCGIMKHVMICTRCTCRFANAELDEVAVTIRAAVVACR